MGRLLNPNITCAETTLNKEHIKNLNAMFEARSTLGPHLEFDVDFTKDEVRKHVLKAKDNKAPGLDGIVNEVLKNDVCIDVLTALFNRCLSSGLLPTAWLKGIISPIPKNASSDPKVPLNYRGISLLPVISKIFTGLVGSRVGGFLERNDLLVNEQNGFRPGRSCVDHIFSLYDLLLIYQKEGPGDVLCVH